MDQAGQLGPSMSSDPKVVRAHLESKKLISGADALDEIRAKRPAPIDAREALQAMKSRTNDPHQALADLKAKKHGRTHL